MIGLGATAERGYRIVCPDLGPGVRRIKHPRGEEARAPCDALLAPGARAARGQWPSKPITGAEMNNSPLTIPPVSRAAPAAIVGIASAAMMGAPERALCQCLNYLDKPFVPLAVALRSMLAETRRKFSPQHQPRSRGSSRGPRCCASGLRRNREPSSQHSCAVIQIGAPALVHHWSQRAASGWPHRAG